MIKGFSKLSVAEKIDQVARFSGIESLATELSANGLKDETLKAKIESFSENVLGVFSLPFSVAPGFVIDGQPYVVPLVTEESSVVAAVSFGARQMALNGGFRTRVEGSLREGQVHISYHADPARLRRFFDHNKDLLLGSLTEIQSRMVVRGGGVVSLSLEDFARRLPGYYQIVLCANTADAMGANFMNTCLEQLSRTFLQLADGYFSKGETPEITMAILSNYTPRSLAICRAPVRYVPGGELSEAVYYRKFRQAFDIARINIARAVTHNKGIMNGIDGVVLATGNDIRAVEAGAHAYACRLGSYQPLSRLEEDSDGFTLVLEVPLAIGTVGGIANLHPMTRLAHRLLGQPGARELMGIVAAVGAASNFSAINALITNGIQQGHMRMHLANILQSLEANEKEKAQMYSYFKGKSISTAAVRNQLIQFRHAKTIAQG